MRIEFGRQKSQNSTSIGLPRWRMLAARRALTHGRFVGNSGAAIVSTGARIAARWRTEGASRQVWQGRRASALHRATRRRQTPAIASQPMLPTISNWISRLSSTAYSIGSSFVTGSMKPLTIIAAASSSVKPREPM